LSELGRVLGGGAALPRHRYRDVWNAVSITESDAIMSVLGARDEEGLRVAAQETLDRLKRTVGIRADDVVLDIGCGVGRMGGVLAPLCRRWIGVDVADNMVRHAARRLSHASNVEVRRISGYDLSGIASRSVDLAYCTVVFMHLDEWDRFKYVSEGYRVLRPGGRMFVDNVNLVSDEGWAFFVEHVESYSPSSRPPHISKTSTPDEMRTYFQRAGFTDIVQESQGLWITTYGRRPEEEPS